MSYKLDSSGLALIFKHLKAKLVAKEDGKGLSTNDYTDEEKNKVAAIPTNTSDLNNDSGFITTADIPEGAAASTTAPKMAGTAATGSELAFARGDHVHPSDTSRVPTSRTINGKDLSNDITLSAADVGAATPDEVEEATTELTNRVSNIENDYVKSSEITSLTEEEIETVWNDA